MYLTTNVFVSAVLNNSGYKITDTNEESAEEMKNKKGTYTTHVHASKITYHAVSKCKVTVFKRTLNSVRRMPHNAMMRLLRVDWLRTCSNALKNSKIPPLCLCNTNPRAKKNSFFQLFIITPPLFGFKPAQ